MKNREEYVDALNSILPESYVQKRDVPTGTYLYLPAFLKESIADMLFEFWNVTKEDYALLVNELVCTVEVTYKPDYDGAPILKCTGSAAIPVQMNRGSVPSKFPIGKKTNALEYNMPAVRIEAISNALGSLGNIFGRNLSRKAGGAIVPADFTIANNKKSEK